MQEAAGPSPSTLESLPPPPQERNSALTFVRTRVSTSGVLSI